MKVLGFIRDALVDVNRRKHVVSRIVEGFVPTLIVVAAAEFISPSSDTTWLVKGIGLAAAGTALQFLLYEFILEPLGTVKNPLFHTGRYWERGPRVDEGEEFKRP